MPIYEKPTKTLMKEFAEATLSKGQTFRKDEVLRWFQQHYGNIKPATVRMHIEAMSVNSRLRKHHPSVRPGSNHDLFYKLGPDQFRLWEPGADPKPVYKTDLLSPEESETEKDDTDEESIPGPVTDDETASSKEFAFERDLKNYLSRNLSLIEPGLRLYEEEGITGIEFPVGGRFIDILAIDKSDNYVVIELKVSRGYDRTMGQLLRYMGWVEKNIAGGKKVRGAIVASQISEDLKLAASRIADVQLVEYELSFSLKPVTT